MDIERQYFIPAVNNLAKNKFHSCSEDRTIVWKDDATDLPTEAEIDAEIIRLEKEYSDNEYARNRQTEYPSIQECVHAILDDDLTALQEKRAAVKAKFPKP